MRPYAIILATLALGAIANDHHEASLTAKGPTYYSFKGPNLGKNVLLDHHKYTSKD